MACVDLRGTLRLLQLRSVNQGEGINLSVIVLFGQTLPGFLRPSRSPGERQHRGPASVGEPLRVRRPFWEAVRPGRKTAARPASPAPAGALAGAAAGKRGPASSHLFQRRH